MTNLQELKEMEAQDPDWYLSKNEKLFVGEHHKAHLKKIRTKYFLEHGVIRDGDITKATGVGINDKKERDRAEYKHVDSINEGYELSKDSYE